MYLFRGLFQHNNFTETSLGGCSGNIYNHGEADNVWVSGSSVNHGDGEEYSYSQQPIDRYEYSEMDNPLNQMVPIPVSFISLEWLWPGLVFLCSSTMEKASVISVACESYICYRPFLTN